MAIPTEGEGENSVRSSSTLDHLMAGGVLLPAQLPAASGWSAERRLAAAVIASALLAVRRGCGERACRRKAREDLEWIFSDEAAWPFSFLPLCQVLSIDPEYVRDAVRRWTREPGAACSSAGQVRAA